MGRSAAISDSMKIPGRPAAILDSMKKWQEALDTIQMSLGKAPKVLSTKKKHQGKKWKKIEAAI